MLESRGQMRPLRGNDTEFNGNSTGSSDMEHKQEKETSIQDKNQSSIRMEAAFSQDEGEISSTRFSYMQQ